MGVTQGLEPARAALGERLSRAVATTTPLAFDRGENAELVTPDGVRYLDFNSGYATTNTGHCHPRVVAAIRAQAERLLHISTVGHTEISSRYAERLCARVPIANAKLFFANSGTEAVEAALKLARYATGRPNVVAFSGGFHGRTLGSLSVSTSKAAFRASHEPFTAGVHFVPYPRESVVPTLDAIQALFREQVAPHRVAAFLVEPVLGEGGYVVPPESFLPALRELCDANGIVLAIDEVQSGFGRTGRLFACEHVGVSPDLMMLGKGIASGLPMGALVGRSELMDAWAPGAHGTTFGGNPVVCAAADATLDALDEEGLVENASARGRALLEALEKLRERRPEVIRNVRGLGLMIGVEFMSADEAARVKTGLLERRIVVSTGGSLSDVIRLAPPLVLTDEHVERFLAAVADAVG